MTYLHYLLPYTVITIIITVFGICYLPSNGGNIPHGMSSEEFQRQQMQIILVSQPFKVAMVGAGLTFVGVIGILIHIYYENKKARVLPG